MSVPEVRLFNNARLDLDAPRPWWCLIGDGSQSDHVHISCPNEHRRTLNPRHTIDEKGVVRASILCPDCKWHVYGILDDWKNRHQPDLSEDER